MPSPFIKNIDIYANKQTSTEFIQRIILMSKNI